jgi:hypothetical protein
MVQLTAGHHDHRPGPDRSGCRGGQADGAAAALDFTDDAAVSAFFGEREPFDHVVAAAESTKTGLVGACRMFNVPV